MAYLISLKEPYYVKVGLNDDFDVDKNLSLKVNLDKVYVDNFDMLSEGGILIREAGLYNFQVLFYVSSESSGIIKISLKNAEGRNVFTFSETLNAGNNTVIFDFFDHFNLNDKIDIYVEVNCDGVSILSNSFVSCYIIY
jgi:hypothetical protein